MELRNWLLLFGCASEELRVVVASLEGVNHGGLGIQDPLMSWESTYNTSKAASRELVDSLETTTKRSGAPLEPGPSSLALSPTNLKSIVGHCRGREPGPERGRKERKLAVARIL